MLKTIAGELKRHVPFTAVGAASGIAVMVLIVVLGVTPRVSRAVFYTLHPIHVVLSAVVTVSMYRLHGGGRTWVAVLIGYSGSIGIATISDAVIPYIGGILLGLEMEFHMPFVETTAMPFIGIPKWVLVNSCAAVGIAVACLRPVTRFPHAGHVLLSTWASLFSFSAFAVADWIPLLPSLFAFLFLAVWLPCCASDIVYPLLWAREASNGSDTQRRMQ
jgi:hypothetical protein